VNPSDAGPPAASSDAGDAGYVGPIHIAVCSPAGPAPDGGNMTVGPGPAATVSSPQDAGWQRVSSSADCAALTPRAIPGKRDWLYPDAFCYAPSFNDQGDITVNAITSNGFTTSFVPANGALGATVMAGRNDLIVSAISNGTGFMVLQYTSIPTCNFIEPVSSAGIPIASPQLVDTTTTNDEVWGLFVNPVGGYVEASVTNEGSTLQLRWIDNSLKPLGGWHTVLSWEHINNWSLIVDQTGKALVLSFLYPPSFGGTPPPSTWTFTAQWMDAHGSVGEAFTPIAPIFNSGSTALFPGFGAAVPLAEGGFAMFSDPAPPSSGGTISPTGWYAYYPSGQDTSQPVPQWLHTYDNNSANLIGGGSGYAAIRRDPDACTLTALLIAPSGETCFALPLEGAQSCLANDWIARDGSVIIWDGCHMVWWPGLTRPAQ
jgi:hypothetical protein